MSDAPDEATAGRDGTQPASVRALTALNLFIGDVQTGMGPYVTLFLKAQQHYDPAQIGTVIAAGNLAQVLSQTPIGAAIDRSNHKRILIMAAAALIAAGGLLIALLPKQPAVMTGQAMIGVAGSVFPPCIAAIALGLVGRDQMDRQTGRNQTFNAAGRVMTALLAVAVGWFFGLRSVLFLLVGLSAAAIFCVSRIHEGDINQALARGADGGEDGKEAEEKPKEPGGGAPGGPGALGGLLKDRRVLVFLTAAVLFQSGSAALIPLITQSLSAGRPPRLAVLFTAGFVIAAQLAAAASAAGTGRLARARGRKPALLLAFGTLAVLAVLLTLSHNPFYLIGMQSLGGVCIGLFGVTGILVIADLTKGSGSFNAAQGAVASATGIGAFLSNLAAGLIARHAGQNTAFLTLAGVAAFGLVFTWRLLAETRPPDDDGDKKDEGDGDDH